MARRLIGTSRRAVIRALCVSGVLGLLCVMGPSAVATEPLHIRIEPAMPFFSPVTAAATEGAVISWLNATGEPHTIVADTCLRRGRCPFESQVILPGATFRVPSLAPGRYDYHCGIHPFMRGSLTVRESSRRNPPAFRFESI